MTTPTTPWPSHHMSRDEVLAHLSRAARFDPRSLFDATGNLKPPQDWSEDTAAAIAGIDIEELQSTKRKDADDGTSESRQLRKIKTVDRIKALELLGKVHGLFDSTEPGSDETDGGLAALLAQAAEQNGGVHGLLR
ncbi:hypothetical protein D0B54_18090 [Solimonas sp. K1W22B-7]|uniref:terminase small subunit n=1 Tax=Solimonas sp. K1W22B-7 TaxID=2303331 RepID=UPI000E3302A3|nr:terminase small subunit [Solimonas sp. K1W22B-7]AXQ30470.1 hypothetical protein D0B54_18090 [Solimonas sp. K1W22B-7]